LRVIVLLIALAIVALAAEARAAKREDVQDRVVTINPLLDPPSTRVDVGVGLLLTPNIVMTARHVAYPNGSALGRALCTPAPGPKAGVVAYDIRGKGGAAVKVFTAHDVTVRLPDQSEDLDVAFLVLASPFPGVTGEAPISVADDDEIPEPGASILTRRGDVGEVLSTPVDTPRNGFRYPCGGSAHRAVQLAYSGRDGDSGSPIFSEHFQRIVGVYTGEGRDDRNDPVGVGTSFFEPELRTELDNLLHHPPPPPTSDLPGFSLRPRLAGLVFASWGPGRPLQSAIVVAFEALLGATFDLRAFDTEQRGAFGVWAAVAGQWASYRNTYGSPADPTVELSHDSSTLLGIGGEGALVFRFGRTAPLGWALLPGFRLLRVFYNAPDTTPLESTLFAAFRMMYGNSPMARGLAELRLASEWSPNTHYVYKGLDGAVFNTGPSVGFVMALGVGIELN
jgi:hypothetical protein